MRIPSRPCGRSLLSAAPAESSIRSVFPSRLWSAQALGGAFFAVRAS